MKMVDLETVCCMCGDVGFPDKIFRCSKCHNRYQHSYCSSYYSEQGEQVEVCDWCESEAKRKNGGKHGNGGGGSSKRSYRSEYSSADSIKQQVRQGNLTPPPADKAKIGGVPSPRTTTRRWRWQSCNSVNGELAALRAGRDATMVIEPQINKGGYGFD
ncbi:PREDICTED: uncharacterized protein LOC104817209 isoform X5 [Tarenaya hassleriana]|uniref:uncharacterized protein LOC104817209 isoform X5 n=1 Tax=Tarenaya hassleriana TaxID=28532 RepID=UPI00053C4BA5|nr:PREDICTED: uncharacterized protein LOC104817209 isoform X5 [Tarenaya hassleriana]